MEKSFGFDLDNTLIDYSAAVNEYCRRNGLLPCFNVRVLRELLGKNSVSDHEWQLAQCWLYTEGMQFAQVGLGSYDLCNYLIQQKYKLFIVSHKTSHTPDFCGSIPLHELANKWLKKSLLANYFKESDQIYYEPTRKLKVKRIRDLNLKYFVDDLEEVFNEPDFPINTKRFLIYKSSSHNSNIKCVSGFIDIKKSLADGF